jgi:FkbM family methyltransferase
VKSPGRYRELATEHLRRLALLAWLHPRGSDLVRLGSDYGGKWVPQTALRPGAVAYCAGAGEDVSFDLALADAGLAVTTFDPTPRSIKHVEGLGERAAKLRFVPLGWWDQEQVLRFYAPLDPNHVSHSAMNPRGTEEYFEASVKPVHVLAAELGDARIDLIKMDIEGAEIRVIPSLLEHGITPSVLAVEFDQPQPLAGIVRAIGQLQAARYRAVKMEGWDLTFVREP